MIRHHQKGRTSLFTPQCPVGIEQLLPDRLTKFDRLTPHTRDRSDRWTDPEVAHIPIGTEPWTSQTIFRIRRGMMQLPEKQHRQLTQVKASRDSTDTEFDVIEVFSPPRFALEGAKMGFKTLSANLVLRLGSEPTAIAYSKS